MEEQVFYVKIQQGDVAAFEQLYKKYHPKAFAFCKSILRDPDKAKEMEEYIYQVKESIGPISWLPKPCQLICFASCGMDVYVNCVGMLWPTTF